MARIGWVFLSAVTFAIMLLRTVAARAEDDTPTLRYIEEYTNTTEIRDIAVFADKIWTATEGGIAVYDAQHGDFLFKLTSRSGLFGNSVARLVPTSRGTLLVTGDYGTAEIAASCNNPKESCFLEEKHHDARFFNPIMDVVQNGDVEMLLGHQSGLFRRGRKPAHPEYGMWRTAAATKTGVVIGGMDGRLMRVSEAGTDGTQMLRLEKPILRTAAVPEGLLVLSGTDLLLVENNRTRPVLFGSKPIAATEVARAGARTLVGTTQGEIFEYQQQALRRLGTADGRITALLSDGVTIWCGVSKKGLYRLPLNSDTAIPVQGALGEICSNHVTRMTTFNKHLIAGTFDNGACALKGGVWQMLDGLDRQYVHGVASDGLYLWAATSNGIVRFDANLEPVPLNDADPKEVRWFAASAVTALAETGNGIALGSPWGVIRVTRNGESLSAEFISRFKGAPEHLTAIVRAPGGLLVSSETEGVRFVGKKRKDTRIFLDPVHLPEAWILDVATAKEGFWAAACQHGVAYVNGDKGMFISTSNGLADNRTLSVAPYKEGAFVATLGGLSFARTDGTATSPFGGNLPDPRGAMTTVLGNRLYLGTEFGTAVFAINTQ